ncbi:hypothetical protein KBD49_04790 [Myxococcota bacterium]|nr:hypothetical protein [Myxococcota bacterium]
MAGRKKDRVTKEELKGPDEFQESMAKVAEFFRLWGGWIGAGVAMVLMGITAGILLHRMGESRAVERAREWSQALEPLSQAEKQAAEAQDPEAEKAARERIPVQARETLARIDAWIAKGLPGSMKASAQFTRGAAAMQAGDWALAREAFRSFLDAEPRSPLAWLAWEAYGIASDLAGQRADAERAFLEMAKSDSGLARANAWMHLGDLYHPAIGRSPSDAVDAGKARENYQKALEAVSGPEDSLPVAQLLVRRLVEERLVSLR